MPVLCCLGQHGGIIMKKSGCGFLPVIFGTDETAYGCARLFYENYGADSVLLGSRAHPATDYSRIFIRKLIPNLDTSVVFRREVPKILKDLISDFPRLFLIPCSERYTCLLVRNAPLIGRFAENRLLSPQTYEKIQDKLSLFLTCSRLGLSYPSCIISTPSVLCGQAIPFDFPCMLYPVRSELSCKVSDINEKHYIGIYTGKDELMSALSALISAGHNEPVILQAYSHLKNIRIISAYCGMNAKVRLIGAQKPIQRGPEDSFPGRWTEFESVYDREICGFCADFLERIGFRGFACVELITYPESGKYLFSGFKPCPGASFYNIRAGRYDLIRCLVEDITERSPYKERLYADGGSISSLLPTFPFYRRPALDFANAERPDTVLSYSFDFSPARMLSLLRYKRSAKENSASCR